MVCLLKTSGDLQMLFAAMTHLVEGLSLETLLTLNVEKSLIFLVGIWRPKVSIIRRPTFNSVLENANKK
jgi:hypothetical protein